jgi:hypothetical protein
MGTSYLRFLKTIKNLAEKQDLPVGTCLNLLNSFRGCDQILQKKL